MGSVSAFFKNMFTPEEVYDEYENEGYEYEQDVQDNSYDSYSESSFVNSYEEIPYEEPEQTVYQEPVAVTTPVVQKQSTVVVMLTPYDIRTSQVVCDHIKQGHIVICNLTSSANNQRVVYYISGGIYALDGKIEPTPVKTTFVCTPKSVELVVDSQENTEAGTKVSAL